ncbi:MAG: cytochrome-c peroxidase [Bryobacteraceae bacterium]
MPPPDASGFRNEPIRLAVLRRLNDTAGYRSLFGSLFPSVAAGCQIDFTMVARAIAEFEFTLVFADAPIDRFARGQSTALTSSEKKGALFFFGTAGCVSCHAVGGGANEMFSDFQMHVAGVPQIAPFFGPGEGNVVFDGPAEDEDYGLEQVTGDIADRYKFRTSPCETWHCSRRSSTTALSLGWKTQFVITGVRLRRPRSYSPAAAGIAPDLRYRVGPIEPVLARLDPLLTTPLHLSDEELGTLVAFVGHALLDRRADKQNLCRLVPVSVPSGLPILQFEGCSKAK